MVNENDDKNEKAVDDGQGQTKKIPVDADVTHTKAFQGLLADKQTETGRRQALEEEIARLREQIVERDSITNTDKGEESLEDDDLLTVSQFNKLLEEREQKAQERARKLKEAEVNQRFLESEQKAKEELTADKMGAGLDFSSVLEAGKANLTEGDRLNIQSSANPAREAYDACIRRTPSLQKLQKTAQNSSFLAELNKGGGSPRGGGGAAVRPGDKENDTYESILKSSADDSEILQALKDRGDD